MAHAPRLQKHQREALTVLQGALPGHELDVRSSRTAHLAVWATSPCGRHRRKFALSSSPRNAGDEQKLLAVVARRWLRDRGGATPA